MGRVDVAGAPVAAVEAVELAGGFGLGFLGAEGFADELCYPAVLYDWGDWGCQQR